MDEEEWKTAYDVQIYVITLYFQKMIYMSFFCYVLILVMRRFQSYSIF